MCIWINVAPIKIKSCMVIKSKSFCNCSIFMMVFTETLEKTSIVLYCLQSAWLQRVCKVDNAFLALIKIIINKLDQKQIKTVVTKKSHTCELRTVFMTGFGHLTATNKFYSRMHLFHDTQNNSSDSDSKQLTVRI